MYCFSSLVPSLESLDLHSVFFLLSKPLPSCCRKTLVPFCLSAARCTLHAARMFVCTYVRMYAWPYPTRATHMPACRVPMGIDLVLFVGQPQHGTGATQHCAQDTFFGAAGPTAAAGGASVGCVTVRICVCLCLCLCVCVLVCLCLCVLAESGSSGPATVGGEGGGWCEIGDVARQAGRQADKRTGLMHRTVLLRREARCVLCLRE